MQSLNRPRPSLDTTAPPLQPKRSTTRPEKNNFLSAFLEISAALRAASSGTSWCAHRLTLGASPLPNLQREKVPAEKIGQRPSSDFPIQRRQRQGAAICIAEPC